MGLVRQIAKKVLPDRFIDWYRRRRATRNYLRALSYELLERQTRLDDLEARIAARRDGFYQQVVRDVLERTEIILQELDRRIEGLSARTGNELRAVEGQLAQLRADVATLRERLDLRGPGDRARRGLEQPTPTDATA